MKHLCVKIKEENQDVAYCVNQQREGVKGMFDNTLDECENLESVDIDAHIKALIDDRNNGEEEIMRLIDEKKINESGFANQDDALWLTIGTYDDLVKEVEQEIEYQKERRENEEKAVKKYLSEIGKRGGKKGGSSTSPKKSASSAANLDRARADGKKGGYPLGRKREFFAAVWSAGWTGNGYGLSIRSFESKKERDIFVKENNFKNGNTDYRVDSCTSKEAQKYCRDFNIIVNLGI